MKTILVTGIGGLTPVRSPPSFVKIIPIIELSVVI